MDLGMKLSKTNYSPVCLTLFSYIPPQHLSPVTLLDVTTPPFPWDTDQYYRPVLADDPLLQYDFEESMGEGEGEEEGTLGDENQSTHTHLQR